MVARILGGVAVMCATIGLLAPWAIAADQHKLRGVVQVDTLGLDVDRTAGASCVGDEGYDDMRPGAQVVVRDGRGKVRATGRLGAGIVKRIDGGDYCVFTFGPIKVPDSTFYAVEVSHRGEINYSRKDLVKTNWRVSLSLG